MKLSEIRLFKAGIFNQTKYLFSTPQSAQRVLYGDSQRNLTLEMLPTEGDHCYSQNGGWGPIESSKLIRIPGVDGMVFPISFKTRYPVNPYDERTFQEKRNASSLDALCASRSDKALLTLSDRESESPNVKLLTVVLWIVGGLGGLLILVGFIRGC